MSKDDERWNRWNTYQETGKWPQPNPVSSRAQAKALKKEISGWARRNPANAAYDNDGKNIYAD